MNPGSLNIRLKELRALHIVDHTDGGYNLTGHRLALTAALKPLQTWAEDWAQRAGVAEQ